MDMSWYQSLSIISTIIVGLLTALATVYWFLLRSLIADMSRLREDLSDHKLFVAETYARDDELKSLSKGIFDKLEDVKNTLSRMDIAIATITERVKHVV